MRFEDMPVWQDARVLVSNVYKLTKVPVLVKDFGLSSQIQRAAVSVMTNIAEGFERQHLQEKIQFDNIARASTREVRFLLYVVEDKLSGKCLQCPGDSPVSDWNWKNSFSGLIKSTQARK